jgi:protein-disulfide isomerase
MKKLMALAALSAACGGDLEARIAKLEDRVVQLEQKSAAGSPKAIQALPIQVHDDDPFIGAKQAKVTIVEAFEFACPYCAMLDPIMDEVMEKYEGQPVKLVEKQFVVHPQIATDAALAVCAANKLGAYEKYTEALWDRSWKNEGRWAMNQQALAREALIALASELGLDREQFTAELDGAYCKTKLNRDKTELARSGVRATPSMYINGKPYQGARTVEAISEAIELARKGG